MFLRSASLAVVFGAAMLATATANATVLTYTDQATWAAAAGGPVTNTTTDSNGDSAILSSIQLDDGTTLDTNGDLVVVRIVPTSWATWSGGYTGFVYDVNFSNSITINLSGVSAFGFEIEPAPLSLHTITLTLSDGQTIVQSVDGDGGAKFFGWTGETIDSFTISSDTDVAFGNIYSVRAANAAPEPFTLALLGAGLAGMGAIRRSKA